MFDTDTRTTTATWETELENFAAALSAAPKFVEFDLAREGLESDAEAQRMMREWKEAQRSARPFAGLPEGLSGDSSRLRATERNLRANPMVQQYFTAQDSLQALLQEVAALISQQVGFDFARACAPSTGCCE